MEQLRAVIIGYGGMGSKYADLMADQRIQGLVLAGICCRNERGQAQIRERFPGVSVYENVKDTFDHKNDFDMAVIVTPHTNHVEIGLEAVKAGKHMLIDKPIGVTTREAGQLIREARRAKVTCAMIYNVRMNPVYRKAKELIEAGRLGRLSRAVWVNNILFRTEAYHHSAPWRSTWKGEGGGLLINQAQHYLDIWRDLLGMPESVTAFVDYGRYSTIEVDDRSTLQFSYENGLCGTFLISSGENPGINRLEIWGTKGRLCVEDNCRIVFDENVMSTEEYGRVNTEVYGVLEHRLSDVTPDESIDGYQMLFQNVADHILKGENLCVTGDEGYENLMIANGAYLSSWTGKAVKYPIDDEVYVSMLEHRRKI